MLFEDTPPGSRATPSNGAPRHSLRQVALAAVTRCVGCEPAQAPPALAALLARLAAEGAPASECRPDARFDVHAVEEERELHALARELELEPLEMLVVALLSAVEEDALVARTIAEIQAPLPGARPTLGLLAMAFQPLLPRSRPVLELVLSGTALASGLILLRDDDTPLSERRLSLAPGLLLALRGLDGAFPGVVLGLGAVPEIALPPSLEAELERQAQVLSAEHGTLVVRSGSLAEARTVAATLARRLGKRPAFMDGATPVATGLVPWLLARRMIPVFSLELGPGERKRLPALPAYSGSVVVLTGPDGGVDTATGIAPEWTPAVPGVRERAELWRRALGDVELAETLARCHRHGAGRIAHLARGARQRALLGGAARPTLAHVEEAAWTVEGAGLGGLAQPIRDPVPEAALVTTGALRQELDLLRLRCLARDGLADELGPTLRARHKSGVRALFVGPSGTGKTLAASWLAAQLGKPLYRIDLAATTSKYIGETEKNLAQILARAEQAEIVLLFDEADSMFGRRTEIKDANDRFANAQTNYLLQRLESYEGITILTSNSRARFDSAFSRRLDAILEFTLPGPEERRSLWQSHLGVAHSLSPESMNRLAAVADLAGGHIRNAVLAAAILARAAERRISYEDVLVALVGEYRKLGLPVPQEIRRSKSAGTS